MPLELKHTEQACVAKEEIRHPLSDNDRRALAAMRAAVAPLKGTMSGPDARAPFDDVMEHAPDAPNVTYETSNLSGVTGIWCTPDGADRKAAILYLHGGAYVLGSANAYRHFVGQIATRSKAAVFIAQYRLAPEYPFPAALDDATSVYRCFIEIGVRTIAIVGDSAGGGLALALLSVVASESVTPVAAAGIESHRRISWLKAWNTTGVGAPQSCESLTLARCR